MLQLHLPNYIMTTILHAFIVFKLGCKPTKFLDILEPRQTRLTVKCLMQLLKPMFSEEGSNKRRFESEIYAEFLKYVRQVASM